MNGSYHNSWYRRREDIISSIYGGPEFIQSSAKSEKHAGCEMRPGCEFGEPYFDVVKNGVRVARRATLSGARHVADMSKGKI
jgi:hypothetical protein